MAIWDDYQSSQYSGAALDAARNAAIGQKAPTVTTSGNQAWRDAQASKGQTNLPAVNQMTNPRNTQFARNAPVNTPQQNFADQIPIGGFGYGLGYGSQQMNIGDFMNPAATQRQPEMTGYHWYKGTGGVSGGNNAGMNVSYDDGSSEWVNTTVPGQFPFAMRTTQQVQQSMLDSATTNAQTYGGGGILPSWNSPTGSQVDLTGYGPQTPNLGDPSVGALDNAQRTTNQYGQNVLNTDFGGQIISGPRQTAPNKTTRAGSSTSSSNTGRSFGDILKEQEAINNMSGLANIAPNIYARNMASIQAVRNARLRDEPAYASDKLSYY